MTNIVSNGALVVLIAAMLGACQTTREVFNLETTAEVEFDVAAYVNPDADDRPSPLNVRIIRLRDERQFEQEDFISLYQNAPANLGADFISEQPLKEFLPGEKRKERLNLSEDVRYLGVIAAFSNYEDAKTKLILPINPHQNNEYRILIEGRTIRSGESR